MARPSLFLPRFDATARLFKVTKGSLTVRGTVYKTGDSFPAGHLTQRKLMILHEQRRIAPTTEVKRARKAEQPTLV